MIKVTRLCSAMLQIYVKLTPSLHLVTTSRNSGSSRRDWHFDNRCQFYNVRIVGGIYASTGKLFEDSVSNSFEINILCGRFSLLMH